MIHACKIVLGHPFAKPETHEQLFSLFRFSMHIYSYDAKDNIQNLATAILIPCATGTMGKMNG